MHSAECFERWYGRPAEATAFAPYRVCPIGAHVDHNLGRTTGFAIDKGIHLAYGAKPDGTVEVRSLQFSGCARWSVSSTPPTRQGDWADHLRGATIALGRRFAFALRLFRLGAFRFGFGQGFAALPCQHTLAPGKTFLILGSHRRFPFRKIS